MMRLSTTLSSMSSRSSLPGMGWLAAGSERSSSLSEEW